MQTAGLGAKAPSNIDMPASLSASHEPAAPSRFRTPRRLCSHAGPLIVAGPGLSSRTLGERARIQDEFAASTRTGGEPHVWRLTPAGDKVERAIWDEPSENEQRSFARKTPTATIRFFATLRGLLGGRGSRAPRSVPPAPPARSSRRSRTRLSRSWAKYALFALVTSAVFLVAVSSASAASPWWHLDSSARPASLPSGGEGTLVAHALNVGDASTSGAVTLSVALPAGLAVAEVRGVPQVKFYVQRFSKLFGGETDLGPGSSLFKAQELCKLSGSSVACTYPESFDTGNPLAPYELMEMVVTVRDQGASSGGGLVTSVSGGGAPPASVKRPVPVGGETVFGAEELSLTPEEEGGQIDTRAGSHPFQLTSRFAFRQGADPARPPALPRNLLFKLPPGQIGNATAVPKCSSVDFSAATKEGRNLCQPDTVIGVASITLDEPTNLTLKTEPVPLFNLEPKRGEPARFGFEIAYASVILDTSVRSGPGEDYGVNVSVPNITELVNFLSSTVTFWGAPGDSRHNESRGWDCLASGLWNQGQPCPPSSTQEKPPAFLTLPTGCAAPYATSVEGVSYPTPAAPGGIAFPAFGASLTDSFGNPLSLTGCNQLAFSPTISAQPSADSASSPSGLDVNLNFDDEGLLSAGGVAQSQIKDTTVTLPEGFTINPSSGVGLGGCTEADYAAETLESAPGAGCPNNSKLGTVEIETPLLAQKIQGSLFVAQPHENPFNSLVALYIVAKNPETGVSIKLAGKVTPDPVTGQLTTTFENNPQLPFDHFNFHFREGQQAPLITPSVCGTYTTTAQLTPWSEPLTSLTETSSFQITKGFDGGACPSVGTPPFAPALAAGTVNNNAGAFSPLDVRLTRSDGDAEISGFSTTLPPGLTGVLTGIPFCPEADIALARAKTGGQEEAEPSCPAASKLGHSLVGTGVGSVLAYTPGRIYLAGPYDGDPFSLVSVTSAVVGPFDLGTVVVRFGLRIDPATAQVSVDPTASEPIPHIIQGIVTHVRDIRVYIDRPNFTLNPTSCAPMAIASTLTSNLAQSATISSRFQAASCANLKFTPQITTTTPGKASRANGTSLNFKISYPKGAIGTQSWFNEAKFELPKQLPARLPTIQHSCLAATFEHNRSACPAPSIIGHAIVHTPVLPVPLQGPVYFVSYGGAAFPDAVLVLDGYGVHIELHGNTFIDKRTGVTSATFKNTPDVPFESIEVNLPAGQYSEFGANLPHESFDFCGRKLTMPTLLKAQNGMQIHQNTPVTISGCHKTKTKAQLLAAALKACHKRRAGARAACEHTARKRYGAKATSKQGARR
jgi:hypothetical protein